MTESLNNISVKPATFNITS